jgi:hypothetical protein
MTASIATLTEQLVSETDYINLFSRGDVIALP